LTNILKFLSARTGDEGIELEDLKREFFPTVVVLDGFAKNGEMGVGNPSHFGFAAELNGQVPIGAVAPMGVATASLVEILHERASDDAVHRGQVVDEMVAPGDENADRLFVERGNGPWHGQPPCVVRIGIILQKRSPVKRKMHGFSGFIVVFVQLQAKWEAQPKTARRN
jgi:hypothetical protein